MSLVSIADWDSNFASTLLRGGLWHLRVTRLFSEVFVDTIYIQGPAAASPSLAKNYLFPSHPRCSLVGRHRLHQFQYTRRIQALRSVAITLKTLEIASSAH